MIEKYQKQYVKCRDKLLRSDLFRYLDYKDDAIEYKMPDLKMLSTSIGNRLGSYASPMIREPFLSTFLVYLNSFRALPKACEFTL